MEVQYSWHRPGAAASRLDRVYLPPILEDRARTARYIGTTSDHHAFYLSLEAVGLELLPLEQVAGAATTTSYYWKLNTSALQEDDFLPCVTEAWTGIIASKPEEPLQAGEWWELEAKNWLCDSFSSLSPKKQQQENSSQGDFFTMGLEQALTNGDWGVVEACHREIREIDKWIAAGAVARIKKPLVEEEEMGVFHAAMEGWGGGGKASGLQAVQKAAGEILGELGAVEQEIFTF